MAPSCGLLEAGVQACWFNDSELFRINPANLSRRKPLMRRSIEFAVGARTEVCYETRDLRIQQLEHLGMLCAGLVAMLFKQPAPGPQKKDIGHALPRGDPKLPAWNQTGFDHGLNKGSVVRLETELIKHGSCFGQCPSERLFQAGFDSSGRFHRFC